MSSTIIIDQDIKIIHKKSVVDKENLDQINQENENNPHVPIIIAPTNPVNRANIAQMTEINQDIDGGLKDWGSQPGTVIANQKMIEEIKVTSYNKKRKKFKKGNAKERARGA